MPSFAIKMLGILGFVDNSCSLGSKPVEQVLFFHNFQIAQSAKHKESMECINTHVTQEGFALPEKRDGEIGLLPTIFLGAQPC